MRLSLAESARGLAQAPGRAPAARNSVARSPGSDSESVARRQTLPGLSRLAVPAALGTVITASASAAALLQPWEPKPQAEAEMRTGPQSVASAAGGLWPGLSRRRPRPAGAACKTSSGIGCHHRVKIVTIRSLDLL